MSVEVEFGGPPARLHRLNDQTIVFPIGNEQTDVNRMTKPVLAEDYHPQEWKRSDRGTLVNKQFVNDPPFILGDNNLGMRSIRLGVFQVLDLAHNKIYTYAYNNSAAYKRIAKKYANITDQPRKRPIPLNLEHVVSEHRVKFKQGDSFSRRDEAERRIPRRLDGTIVFPKGKTVNLELSQSVISPDSVIPASEASPDPPFKYGAENIGMRHLCVCKTTKPPYTCMGDFEILDPLNGTVAHYTVSSKEVVQDIAKKYFDIQLPRCKMRPHRKSISHEIDGALLDDLPHDYFDEEEAAKLFPQNSAQPDFAHLGFSDEDDDDFVPRHFDGALGDALSRLRL